MTKKLSYIAFFVASIAGIVSLLALQNSARAYMQCEILGYEDDPSFKSIFKTIFKYESSIFGYIKVTEWNDEGGWNNFCEVKKGTECVVREGYASKIIATPEESDPEKRNSYFVDFYEVDFAVFNSTSIQYECRFLTGHPLLD